MCENRVSQYVLFLEMADSAETVEQAEIGWKRWLMVNKSPTETPD